MVGVTLASHGDFAKGILQPREMIFGTQSNIKAATLQPSEELDNIRVEMEEAITIFENPEQVLFVVDLWGGTPFNQTNGLINGHEGTWAVVTGLSLPILIEALVSRMSMGSAQEIAVHVYEMAKEGVRLFLEVLEPVREKQTAEPVTLQGAIPEGIVIGDGHIKYVLTRIDSRLLHRQVAIAWTKTTKPARTIVVSDGVMKDELRENLIEQTTPPGVKANVVPVDKMIQVAGDPCFGNTKTVLLFGTPQDALHAIEGGIDVEELNIGSMAYSVRKIAVSETLSLGRDGVKTLGRLKIKGIQFGVRKVLNDSKESADDIIKKIRVELV